MWELNIDLRINFIMYKKMIITIFLLCSFIFTIEEEVHFRLYVTGDVKGEREPCG